MTGQPEQIGDGAFLTVGAAGYTWEMRRSLFHGQDSSDMAKTTIDGPCKLVGAYCSVSPIAVFTSRVNVPTTDDILVEVNVNKTYQLTKELEDDVAGSDATRSNAVTLASLTSKDGVRLIMLALPEGQHEVTMRFRWRAPDIAEEQYIDVDCGVALYVQPPTS